MTTYSETLQASLNATAVSGSVTGATIDLGAIVDKYLLSVETTGGNANVGFYGSIDNVNFYAVTGMTSTQGVRAPSSPILPARYIQAQASQNSGSPVVTASVAPPVSD